MAQEIIIGMVNGEQWSYTSCVRVTSVFAYVIRHTYVYTPLHLHFMQILHEFHSWHISYSVTTVYIAALPVYVMSETSIITKYSPKLVRPWSSFGSWHAQSSMPLFAYVNCVWHPLLIQTSAYLSWAPFMSLIECIVYLRTNWKLLCMVANHPTALVNLQEHYFIN